MELAVGAGLDSGAASHVVSPELVCTDSGRESGRAAITVDGPGQRPRLQFWISTYCRRSLSGWVMRMRVRIRRMASGGGWRTGGGKGLRLTQWRNRKWWLANDVGIGEAIGRRFSHQNRRESGCGGRWLGGKWSAGGWRGRRKEKPDATRGLGVLTRSSRTSGRCFFARNMSERLERS